MAILTYSAEFFLQPYLDKFGESDIKFGDISEDEGSSSNGSDRPSPDSDQTALKELISRHDFKQIMSFCLYFSFQYLINFTKSPLFIYFNISNSKIKHAN